VVEPTAHAERALAHNGVLEACAEAAAVEALHAARVALGAEPGVRVWRGAPKPYAVGVEAPQARPHTHQQGCIAQLRVTGRQFRLRVWS
jgi:hypothetical protein